MTKHKIGLGLLAGMMTLTFSPYDMDERVAHQHPGTDTQCPSGQAPTIQR